MFKQILLATLFMAIQLAAQNASYPAELSVPFGSVAGRVLTTSNVLVFYDIERPDQSFVVERSQITDTSTAETMLTVSTKVPIRDRSGERTRFALKLGDSASASAVSAWARSSGISSTTSELTKDATSYEVRHKHLIGGCSGRLLLTMDQIAFESISDLNHSRRWSLKDIKELKRSNPYGLKVIPFTGSAYDLELLGSGMSSEAFKGLVDRVTTARSLSTK